jgi:hypothetical protein
MSTGLKRDWIDTENVAWRFGVDEQVVDDAVEQVEDAARVKMTKVLQDKQLLTYVRELHNREAHTAQCPRCRQAGFDDWLHLTAHLRTHVVDEMLRGDVGSKEAGIALQALRDTDKLMIPVEKHEAEIEIPGGRKKLLDTLGPALGRRLRVLPGNNTSDADSTTASESSSSSNEDPETKSPTPPST